MNKRMTEFSMLSAKIVLISLVCSVIGIGCSPKLETDEDGVMKWRNADDSRLVFDNGTAGTITVRLDKDGEDEFQVKSKEWVLLDLGDGEVHLIISDSQGEVLDDFTVSLKPYHQYVYNPGGHHSYILASKPYGGVPFSSMGPIIQLWHLPAGTPLFSLKGRISYYFEPLPNIIMGSGGEEWRSSINHWTSRAGKAAPDPELLSDKESPFKIVAIPEVK